MVMTAAPWVLPSTTLTAEMVTELTVGTVAGAVYRPLLVIVPTPGSPPALLFTFQVTPWLALPVTVGENCSDASVCTVALPGTTLTLMPAPVGVRVGVDPALPVGVTVRRVSTKVTVGVPPIAWVAVGTMVAIVVAVLLGVAVMTM